MKTSTKITLILALVGVIFIGLQYMRIKSLTGERDRYRSNTTALLRDVERYRTSDSLNAVKTEVLSLQLSEMERYRAEDLKTIESLKIREKDLEQVTTMQMQTIADLRGTVADTVVMVREVRDTVQVLHVSDEWIDLHGIVADGAFDGTLEVRDSIYIVESVQRARFLGFLWRTKRVKSREVDVMNKNPYTEIMGIESIIIER
jgi:hypothetical protein